jgi:hypothetical protein
MSDTGWSIILWVAIVAEIGLSVGFFFAFRKLGELNRKVRVQKQPLLVQLRQARRELRSVNGQVDRLGTMTQALIPYLTGWQLKAATHVSRRFVQRIRG